MIRERIEQGALRIKSERESAVVHVIELSGELDLSSAGSLEDEIRRVESLGAREIVVDLSALSFIDSVGLRTFRDAQSRSREQGRLSFQRPTGHVERVLALTGMDSFLVFADCAHLVDG